MKEITKENLDELLKEEKILIDFNADWCGPCRMLRPILDEITKETDYKIVSINVDKEAELAKEYNVFSIPCLVLLKKGQETNRIVGLKSKDELLDFLGDN